MSKLKMQVATINNQVKTMSTVEIAELTGKRHDNVMRKANELKNKGIIWSPQIEETDCQNKKRMIYRLNKTESLNLVANLSPEFTAKIIDRWQELENQQPKLPNNYIEALQALIEVETEKQALEQQAIINAPKVNHYNLVVNKSNLLTATEVGAKIGKSAIALNKALSVLGVYNNKLKRSKAFKQWFIDKGYGVIKQTDNGYSQALFTTKGEAWIIEQLQELSA